MTSWQEFWEKDNKIDVSLRHTNAHYRALATGVRTLLPQTRPVTILDWGCGEALATPAFTEDGITVLLHDPVNRFHSRITERFRDNPRVRVLTAEDLAALPEQSIDAILIYSVLQYVSKEAFVELLPQFRALLRPGGKLILGDIIPPEHPMLLDAWDLLVAGLRHGFFFDAVDGMVTTLFSEYRTVRAQSGFTTYGVVELIALLGTYGFAAQPMPRNIGLTTHRKLIVATVP